MYRYIFRPYMSDVVSVVKAEDDFAASLKRGLGLIGGMSLRGLPVMVKPNICVTRDPSGGATTSIDLVKALIDIVLEQDRGTSVRIVESDSDSKWLDEAYENFGYIEMVDAYREAGHDVRLVNLSREPSVEVPSKYYQDKLRLPKMLLDPNYLISIAKAKTHTLIDVTGVLKNQFGCIPRKDKYVYHSSIDEVVVEVNTHIPPDLCVVDAVTGMEGVIRGRVRDIGVLILGRRAASTDAVLARVMGFNPEEVRYITMASDAGLGRLDPELTGVPVEEVVVRFRKPNRIASRAGRGMPPSLYTAFRSLYEKFR